MEESIKVNTFSIKSKVEVFSLGPMDDHTTDNGKMANNKVKEFINPKMVF